MIIAFGVKPGLVDKKSDLQDISRNFIYRDMGFAEFKAKLGVGAKIIGFLK